jgi:AraC-like DNA-binding protein
MLFEPKIPELQRHIDHYWIVKDIAQLSYGNSHMYAYPGITPDMLIVLGGHYTIDYMGKRYRSDKSQLFSFIHKEVVMDLTHLSSCIIIKFKSRGLSSLKPFLDVSSDDLMKDSIAFTDDIFGTKMENFRAYLKTIPIAEIADQLDQWFITHYKKEREGFMIEMAQEISPTCDLKTIMEVTKYSYSTIERHFKRDAGLTPKRYQSLQRYKQAVRELYITQNADWQHYVHAYGYYDQSHFIKEIKRYTSFTPAQLLQTPAFIQVRPQYS